MIEEAPDDDEPPPPPPPKIETPPPFVPPPEIAIELPAETTQTTAITQTTSQRPVAQPPPVAAPAPIPRTAPKSDSRRPLSQPEYPPSSRRAGEAGTVILEVLVLENGRVGDARVKQSSGFPRLDEAAVREVEAFLAACAGNRKRQTRSDVGAVRRHIQAHGLSKAIQNSTP